MHPESPWPWIMYGTAWKEEETKRLTGLAIRAGFRAIDTANQRKHYVEAAVGDAVQQAIEEELVTRDALFLQTKFTFLDGQDHRLPYDPKAPIAEQVEQSFQSSLEHLHTDYLDSYVLHGPSRRFGLGRADREAWAAMEALKRAGKCGSLGVSNVDADQLRELVDGASIAPTFVQNRCYARMGWDREVREICDDRGITYQGFSLLTANRSELQSDIVRAIALRHERTIPQVVFRFAAQVGMLPLTGTTDPRHMQEDLAAAEFVLSDEEVHTLESIGD
jgi:diketogulonate reductase-like aldo/keto reductase